MLPWMFSSTIPRLFSKDLIDKNKKVHNMVGKFNLLLFQTLAELRVVHFLEEEAIKNIQGAVPFFHVQVPL